MFSWIIILTGSLFIGYKLINPNAVLNNDEEIILFDNSPDTEKPEIKTISDIPEEKNENQNFQQYKSRGDKYFNAQKYQKAVGEYTKALKLDNSSVEITYKLGQAYLYANEAKKAAEVFKNGILLSPASIDLKLALAQAMINQRQITEAKELIWSLDESNPRVKYYKAILLVLFKDFNSSKNLFSEVANTPTADDKTKNQSLIFLKSFQDFSFFKEGEQIQLQTMLAQNLTQTDQNYAAIPLIFDVLSQKKNYRDAWIVLGYAYLKTGKNADAIDALNQAKTLDSKKPETLFYLGLAYYSTGDIKRAIQLLEDAETFKYTPAEQLGMKLADLYILDKKYSKSEKKYLEIRNNGTKNLNIYSKLVWLYIDRLNEPEKALILAKESMDTFPDNTTSLNLYGWALTANDQFNEASKYLTETLKKDPSFDAAYLNLGWLYQKQGETEKAKENYQKAYKLGDGNAISLRALERYQEL